MASLSIITGAGTGIGRALAIELAQNYELEILAVGRRENKLLETKSLCPDKISVCSADVSLPDGREKIISAIPAGNSIKYLIHNAAILGPVKPLKEMSLNEWREHMAINVEGPLFLSQAALPFLKNGRIMHISSGAAHHPYQGWGAYCTSKAALHMIYQVLRDELKGSSISIGSIRPGVVDTPMQDEVRQVPKKSFPALAKFIELKESASLINPKVVAEKLAQMLIILSDDEFSAQEMDLRDN